MNINSIKSFTLATYLLSIFIYRPLYSGLPFQIKCTSTLGKEQYSPKQEFLLQLYFQLYWKNFYRTICKRITLLLICV